jgi:hypothetical protein
MLKYVDFLKNTEGKQVSTGKPNMSCQKWLKDDTYSAKTVFFVEI